MKKLLAILAIAIALPAAAQFRYGPQVGLNFSTMKFKQDLISVDQAAGPSADLLCEFIFTNFGVGIDFGIGYSMTGAFVNLGEKPVWSLNGFGREHVMLHNLHIPLHIRFKWTKLQGLEDYIAPIVYGGPEFDIQVGHSRIRSNGQQAFKYSGGDFALGCGLGVELLKHWQLTAGYTWGMTYALKTRQLDDFSARWQGWNVRVAYLF
ncbi:MAG: PorT family protein [Bacteroides sp.]|nr:PorT family protein [Bacteroides sp.]MCM1378996.1 PorT family protein [Bacteroides sp.]MCM1445612.1 PorT family protein [Prevotella sp.]